MAMGLAIKAVAREPGTKQQYDVAYDCQLYSLLREVATSNRQESFSALHMRTLTGESSV